MAIANAENIGIVIHTEGRNPHTILGSDNPRKYINIVYHDNFIHYSSVKFAGPKPGKKSRNGSDGEFKPPTKRILPNLDLNYKPSDIRDFVKNEILPDKSENNWKNFSAKVGFGYKKPIKVYVPKEEKMDIEDVISCVADQLSNSIRQMKKSNPKAAINHSKPNHQTIKRGNKTNRKTNKKPNF